MVNVLSFDCIYHLLSLSLYKEMVVSTYKYKLFLNYSHFHHILLMILHQTTQELQIQRHSMYKILQIPNIHAKCNTTQCNSLSTIH